jgi:protein FrlC
VKLSVASSVFVNYALCDAIPLIAEAGLDGIDIWGGRPHVYRADLSPAELGALRRQMEAHHLAVPSLMPAFFRYPHSLSSPNEVVRRDSIDYMCRCVDNAAVLGAPFVLVVPTHTLHGQSVADARQRLVDSIDEVSRYAAQYDLSLGIEPANRMVSDLVASSGDAMAIIDTLGHANLGVVLDTGHLHLTGEATAAAIERIGGRLLEFHVNDNDGRRQQNLVPGDGSYDFAGLVTELRGKGYAGFLAVELAWDYSPDPLPAVAEAVRRLRRLL